MRIVTKGILSVIVKSFSSNIFTINTENNSDDVIKNSDAILVLTAHKEFFSIQPEIFSRLMKKPIVVDTRNLFDPSKLYELQIIYRGIGRSN